MKTLLGSVMVAALASSSFAFGVDCSHANTTVEMKECASQEFAAADAELNALWPKVVAHFKSVDAQVESWNGPLDLRKSKDLIVDAQLSWLQLRDNDALAVAAGSEGGSIFPIIVLSQKTFLTKERTAQLKQIVKGYSDDLSGPGAEHYSEIAKETEACQSGSSTVQWKECVGQIAETADVELNMHYKALKSVAKREHGTGAADLMTKAQLAWIKMRDADCEAAVRINYGGTGESGYSATCHGLHTIERTLQLRGSYQNK